MRLIFLPGLLLATAVLASQAETPDIQLNWRKYRLQVNASLDLERRVAISERSALRLEMRDRLQSKMSMALEDLIYDASHKVSDLLDEPAFAREYAIFIDELEVGNVFFSRDKISARADIPLRGNKGFLRILPLEWDSEKYLNLLPAEYAGEAYQRTTASEEYDTSIAPGRYSGYIIDVRDETFHPSLAPRIYAQDGRLIYGPEFVTFRTGIERGLADFSLKPDEVSRARVGDSPLYIVAMSVKGKYKTDAVLSFRDVRRIFDHKENLGALLRCRVVFVHAGM